MGWAAEIIESAGRSPILSFLRRGTTQVPALVKAGGAEGDSRRHPRTSVALAAVLQHNSTQSPVTIANLSRGGAMIKTTRALSPGSQVHLAREGLSSKAVVLWSSGHCCGLQFPSDIQVGAWTMPLEAVGQRRVDQVVAAFRSGEPVCGDEPPAFMRTRSSVFGADDLNIVQSLLEDLDADLASSVETIRSHPGTLQLLKTAQQVLASPELQHHSRYQFLEKLGEIFELVRKLEDELTCCTDTLVRHSYKLQHLDLAMQMLTEISAEALTDEQGETASTTRLQNLRTACEHALTLH